MKLIDLIHNTKTQAFLAFAIVIGGFLMISFVHLSDTVDNRLFDLMFLTATFYFGSSKSGTAKDDTIANLAANQNSTATTESGDINVKK